MDKVVIDLKDFDKKCKKYIREYYNDKEIGISIDEKTEDFIDKILSPIYSDVIYYNFLSEELKDIPHKTIHKDINSYVGELEEFGRGDQAIIYKLDEKKLLKVEEIKILSYHPTKHEMKEALKDRIKINEKASDLNVGPKIYKTGIINDEKNKKWYILMQMEYLKGVNFGDWKRTRPNEDKIEKVTKLLRDKIDKLHKHSIYHNDLHGGNVFVIEEKNKLDVFIIDFGLSYIVNDRKIYNRDFEEVLDKNIVESIDLFQYVLSSMMNKNEVPNFEIYSILGKLIGPYLDEFYDNKLKAKAEDYRALDNLYDIFIIPMMKKEFSSFMKGKITASPIEKIIKSKSLQKDFYNSSDFISYMYKINNNKSAIVCTYDNNSIKNDINLFSYHNDINSLGNKINDKHNLDKKIGELDIGPHILGQEYFYDNDKLHYVVYVENYIDNGIELDEWIFRDKPNKKEITKMKKLFKEHINTLSENEIIYTRRDDTKLFVLPKEYRLFIINNPYTTYENEIDKYFESSIDENDDRTYLTLFKYIMTRLIQDKKLIYIK